MLVQCPKVHAALSGWADDECEDGLAYVIARPNYLVLGGTSKKIENPTSHVAVCPQAEYDAIFEVCTWQHIKITNKQR